MGFWRQLLNVFNAPGVREEEVDTETREDDDLYCINPATGLPMLTGSSNLDVAGHAYGQDGHEDEDDAWLTDDSYWEDD